MDSTESFASEAMLFEQWLLHGTDQDADAVREGLVRLLRLYDAALRLPSAWSDEIEATAKVERLGDVDWRHAYRAAGRLPVDNYSEVYNPTTVPGDEPVVGSVCDDLADIYRDVVSGLRACQGGNRAAAVWHWALHFHAHWGAHATSAIRALHWWLSENATSHTQSERQP